MESNVQPTKDELLNDYAKKPMRVFLQIDGLAGLDSISAVQGDDFGRALMSGGWQYELQDTGADAMPLRILVHQDAKREDVVALLHQAADWLAKDWFDIIDEKPPSVTETPTLRAYGDDFFPAFEEQPPVDPNDDIPF